MYDLARFRQRMGLAHTAQNFASLAHETVRDLATQLDAGKGKSVYRTYITCIEKYFLPYFGELMLEDLTARDIAEFEVWRNRQLPRAPKTSTLMNFASAWNRLAQTAVDRGWISERVPVPKLTTQGVRSVARPAFTRAEIDLLRDYIPGWIERGQRKIDKEMRLLLRDYIDMLLLTGMRHGTESMGICWQHVTWHTDRDVRYLRIWVDGKTGGRWLIAKHAAVDVLLRLHARQTDIADLEFETVLSTRVAKKLFRFANGYQPPSLNCSFRVLLRDCGLLVN
jgi:integrase